MTTSSDELGFFGKVGVAVGFIAGAALGAEAFGCMGVLIGGFGLGIAAGMIGSLVDKVVEWLLVAAALLLAIAINAAFRQMIFSFVLAVIEGLN